MDQNVLIILCVYLTQADQNGMNVFVLQKWLGHSDISVTQEYVNLYTDDLAQNIQNINPLDTLIPFSASKKNKKKLVINELKEKQGV